MYVFLDGDLSMFMAFDLITSLADISINVQNGSFAWGHDKEDKDTLSNINLSVKTGSLVAVVGTVGAGKSSICSALLGDMEKKTGSVNIQVRCGVLAWLLPLCPLAVTQFTIFNFDFC